METTKKSRPTITTNQQLVLHNKKASVLSTLAIMLGCYSDFIPELPDGKRPDVLRYDANNKTLFIGDAKNTETPRNKNTQQKLFAYLLWLSAFTSKPKTRGVFAICFTDPADLDGWLVTVRNLARAASINFSKISFDQIDEETNLVWFLCSS